MRIRIGTRGSRLARIQTDRVSRCLQAAGPEAPRRAAKEMLRRVPARGHVVNLGHGIMPQTPLESVHALVEVVHGEVGAHGCAP